MMYSIKKKNSGQRQKIVFFGLWVAKNFTARHHVNYFINRILTIHSTCINCKLLPGNRKDLTLIWVGFLGVYFQVGVKLPPCLKLDRIMLETSNVARK